jgi:hypothetical protein
MPNNDLSISAKIYLLSGKISHLTAGFCFTKSPTGEMVNTQRLAEGMILATLLELVKDSKLEMRNESKKVLFMVAPIIMLKRLNSDGTGLAKAILDRLTEEKKLTDVITEIIGGVYLVPQYTILGFAEKELAGLFNEVEVKKMLLTRKEKVWDEKKVADLVKKYQDEAQKAFQETIDTPLRMMALSSLHIAWGQTTEKRKDHDLHDHD